MTYRTLALRWLALAAMSVWLGGFTFYAAFVIPVLHDEMGAMQSGAVTGIVTNPLNVVGVVTVVLWWAAVWSERTSTRDKVALARVGLLGVTTFILALLIALHPLMDDRLDSGKLQTFHGLHFVYLNASTVQWGVNLGLLATAVSLWGGRPAVAGTD